MKAACYDYYFSLLLNEHVYIDVISVYSNVINLKYKDTYYSIINKNVPKANYFLQINEDINFLNLCEPNEKLEINKNIIEGKKIKIDLTSSICHNWETIKFKYSDISVSYIDSLIKKETLRSGTIDFYKNYYFGIHEESDAIDMYLKSEIKKLNDFLLKKETSDNFKIVGVGLGSTPSGDDYLCGFLYCCNQINDLRDLKKYIIDIIEKNIYKTTDISKLMYQIYLNNGHNEVFYSLLKAMSDSSLFSVEMNYKKIKKIGHSSGIDFLIGIMNALKIYKERKQ